MALTGKTEGVVPGPRMAMYVAASLRKRLNDLLERPEMEGVNRSEFLQRAIVAAEMELETKDLLRKGEDGRKDDAGDD